MADFLYLFFLQEEDGPQQDAELEPMVQVGTPAR
jgi:hypothetical protein